VSELSKKDLWHLEKNVSVGHLITTVTIVIGVVIFVMKMDARITKIEVEVKHNTQTSVRIEGQVQQKLHEIMEATIRIEQRINDMQTRNK